MARLVVTFRGFGRVEFRGPVSEVESLADRIRDAMTASVDAIISHDLDQEPKSFLCSEIVDLHQVEPEEG
ncbi:MAG: hypothetical protein ACYTDY_04410 [Planctomycetota bacterium]